MQGGQSRKLEQLRQTMKDNNISGYLIPHGDQHDSEYIADCDQRIGFQSGFTGSAGFCFVSLEEAYLWTDSRYFLQADKQLEQGWELKKMVKGFQPWYQFAAQKYGEGYTIGYDPLLIPASQINLFNKTLQPKKIELKPLEENLVDKVWGQKPLEPTEPIIVHELKWHNYSFNDKYMKIREALQNTKLNSDFYLTARLDEIAWALNLRGSDIQFNPVFKSYLILNSQLRDDSNGTLYTDCSRLSQEVQTYLASIKINFKGYNDVFQNLQTLSQTGNVAFQDGEINQKLYTSIQQSKRINLPTPSPINALKAIKNETEIQGFTNCHIRDGSALVSYLAWLEDELVNKGNTELTEYTAANVLEQKRRALENNVGLSFDTISSIGANGAIVHYKPEESTASKLNPDLVYLVDSGGQYYDGTTDVTRTMHFKTPTDEQRDSFTRVLLGNLDIQMLIWPEKNSIGGSDMDILARRYLWNKKLDFGHGTGHGVGFFLNVHEGPHGISKHRSLPFKPGYIVTDEPGYYKTGEYGIRCEDELVVEDIGEGFYGFRNFTQCPYDRNLIQKSLLTQDHVDFLNIYHQKVYNNIAPLLEKNNDQIALAWLKRHTAPL